MDSPAVTLHFVLFPLMTPGHMIPMIDIARILAERGATVTVITTPVNANRFKPVIARAIKANLKIQVLELQLPVAEVGLPEGCESFDMLRSSELSAKLFAATEMLQEPAEKLIQELSPSPSCIISDNSLPWTMDVARRFKIPRLVLHGPGCFYLMCMHVVYTSNALREIQSDSEPFVLPGLPDRIEVTKPQVFGMANAPRGTKEFFQDFFQRIRVAEKAAYGILVNSFQELEPEYAKEVAKVKDKGVWCIGPVSLCNKSNLDMVERGNKAVINEHDCLKWLDSREQGSVVYACLGTLSRSSEDQVIELGLGLESSNRPFVWCIRNMTEGLERWISGGFGERVKDRALILKGWAPQVLILSHKAIGGFITHCGWNSILEAVSAGLPMGTWPFFADQFLNERFVVDVLKIGVKTGVEVPVLHGQEEQVGVLVTKEDIKTTVEDLMDSGENGKERRNRARELAEMAKRAMEEGGSSYLNMTSVIQDITKQLAENKKSDG